MSSEFFDEAGKDSGAALQAAWLGGPARGHLVTGSSRRHLTITSCAAEVRRVLYAAGRALKLGELHKATGHERAAIGSALVKLQRRYLVVKIPCANGTNYGASYLWVGAIEPEARQMFT